MTSEDEIRLDAAWGTIAKWSGQEAYVDELHGMSCAECSLCKYHIDIIFQAIRPDQDLDVGMWYVGELVT